MPAKAGIQGRNSRRLPWTPAFAGATTEWGESLPLWGNVLSDLC